MTTSNATARLPMHSVVQSGLSMVRASIRAGTCIAHDEKCNVNASVNSVTARRDGTECGVWLGAGSGKARPLAEDYSRFESDALHH